MMNQTTNADDALLTLDNQLCFALYSTSHAMTRVYRPLLAPLGLTYPQYMVMLVLWEQDAQPLSEIGHKLYLDSGTLTPLLKRLEKSKLVVRERDRTDERRVLIRLTDSGRQLREHARTVPRQLLAGIDCPLQQRQSLLAQISELRDQLHATLGAHQRNNNH
ncbi:MarR family transcriptional regulator [Granulosicoccaceae sp. 1_MG-2023]|nr:MarR family transcriptional regulator [Granulosicoccaceae sp. 1_MG-2023]